MTDIDQRRREVEEAMNTLVEGLSSKLSKKNLGRLHEFIENREYVIALEWLHSIIVEKKIGLSDSQKSEMQRLAQRLGVNL
jgi:hypothetical protein